MIDFKNFKIKRGPSKDLHDPRLIVEEGYWYLSTDSAELFIGIEVDGVPQLKPINDTLFEAKLANYATVDFVEEALKSIDIPEINVDDFATKEELNTKADISYIDEKVANLISSEGLATEKWVENQNYLTAHQDISGKQDAIDDLEEIRIGAALGKTALQEIPAEYAKKDDLFNKDYNELINKPEGLATESFVLERISEAEIGEKEIDLSEYAKKEELFSKDYNDLENKPAIPEAYDDSELRNLISSKADSVHSHEEYALAEHTHDEYLTDLPEHTHSYNNLTDKPDLFNGDYNNLTNKPDIPEAYNDAELRELLNQKATKDEIPTKVSELENDANYANETRVLELIENKASAKIGIDFVTDITVGHLAAGTEIKAGMTISQLVYRILFAGSQPDEPEVPEGIIGEIITNELPLYYVNNSGSLTELPFEITTLTEEQAAQEPTKSGFYQIVDGENNVIESGYHDLSVANQDLIYMLALPKSIKAENISVQTFSDEEKIWEDNTFELTDDISIVNEICDIYGMDISNIDTDKYTVWVSASENVCTGSKIRYIITE